MVRELTTQQKLDLCLCKHTRVQHEDRVVPAVVEPLPSEEPDLEEEQESMRIPALLGLGKCTVCDCSKFRRA